MSKHFRLVRGPAKKPPRPFSPVMFAGPQDADDLVRFLGLVRDEIDGGRVEDELLFSVARDLANHAGGVAFIVRGEDGVEASMGVRLSRPDLSRVPYLRTVWHVVLPEARMTGHAKSLLVEARNFADQLGRPLMIEEQSANLEAPKVRLLQRHFAVPASVVAWYRPAAVA